MPKTRATASACCFPELHPGRRGGRVWHSQARPLALAGGLADESSSTKWQRPARPRRAAGGRRWPAARWRRQSAAHRRGRPHPAAEPAAPPAAGAGAGRRHARRSLLAAGAARVAILPRPGKLAMVDFPVQIAGEVSGTIYLLRAGTRREAGGVELELLDGRGEVVARTRSAADGFYDLDRLAARTFIPCVVAPEQAARSPGGSGAGPRGAARSRRQRARRPQLPAHRQRKPRRGLRRPAGRRCGSAAGPRADP